MGLTNFWAVAALILLVTPASETLAEATATRAVSSLDGRAVFLANDGSGHTYFFTDGTAAGTFKLKLTDPPRALIEMHSLPGAVAIASQGPSGDYYINFVNSAGVVGSNMNPPTHSVLGPKVIGSKLYWRGADPATLKIYLMASDGVTTNAYFVPRSDVAPDGNEFASYPFEFNGNIYITTIVCSICEDTSVLHTTVQVWRVSGSSLVKAWKFRFRKTPLYWCCISFFSQLGSEVLFANWTNASGAELWATDGTDVGKHKVKEIFVGVEDGVVDTPFGNPVVGGRSIFMGRDLIHGFQLWASDGTKKGTVRLTSIPGLTVDSLYKLHQTVTVHNGTAFFWLNSDSIGGPPHPVYETDGTRSGTKLIPLTFGGNALDIYPDADPRTLKIAGNWIYLTARVESGQYGFYRVSTRTHIVQVVKSPLFSIRGAAVGKSMIFLGCTGTGSSLCVNDEPWVTDGTTANTTKIKEIFPGSLTGSNPGLFTPLVSP